MIDVINLTPHPLTIYDGDRKYSPIPSSGIVRVSQKTEKIGDVAGIPVYQTVFGSEIEGLPEPFDSDDEKRVYVVSRIAAEAIRKELPARAMPTSWPRLERWQEPFACAGGVNVQAGFHICGVPGSAAHSNRL